MRRRTFLQSAAATVTMGTLVDFAKAEFAPEYPWEKTIFNPRNGVLALLDDFQKDVGKYGKHFRGILLCQHFNATEKVFRRLVRHCGENHRDYSMVTVNMSKYTITWHTGEYLLVRTMRSPDDYWDYHGAAYQWIGFESITDWPTRECYNRMRAPLRWPHADDIPWKPPEGLPRMRSTYYG